MSNIITMIAEEAEREVALYEITTQIYTIMSTSQGLIDLRDKGDKHFTDAQHANIIRNNLVTVYEILDDYMKSETKNNGDIK
jgi:hypothetical protein